MATKTRKPKAKNPLMADPFLIKMGEMTEEHRAKVIDDALVYLGLSDTRLPTRLYIANADVDEIARKTDANEGLRHWLRHDETLSLLRPGFFCRLAVDDIRTTAKRDEAHVTRIQLMNSGELDIVRYKYRRTPMMDNVSLVVNPSVAKWVGTYDGARPVQICQGSSWEAQAIIRVAMEMWARKRRMWSTFLSEVGSEHYVGLCTDASSIKEMYKLREKPEGRTRRAALLHLVTGHWRRVANAVEDRIFIEKHLRGAREFEWFGLKAQIAAQLDT